MEIRTLRRNLEIVNLWAISLFGVLGVFVFVLGITKSSNVLIVMGALYAGITAWYLYHLLTRVASRLRLDTSSNQVTWQTPITSGVFALEDVRNVRQSPQPDVYMFVFDNAKSVHFWHRNRHDDAQSFFRELRLRNQKTSFDPLYASCKASWRRGLPLDGDQELQASEH
jgi:hypothetical protein